MEQISQGSSILENKQTNKQRSIRCLAKQALALGLMFNVAAATKATSDTIVDYEDGTYTITLEDGTVYSSTSLNSADISTYTGTTYGNTIIFNSGYMTGTNTLTGAYGSTVYENSLIFNGGTWAWIYGGHTSTVYGGDYAELYGNSITFNDGTVSNVYGAFSEANYTYLHDNSVIVNGGTLKGYVFAANLGEGYDYGTASNNTLTINGGTFSSYAFGAITWQENSKVTGNTAIISGGTLNGNSGGGYALYGLAADNVVKVTGGNIYGNVHGGYAVYMSLDPDWLSGAYGNQVVITSGTDSDGNATTPTINANVYGNYVADNSRGDALGYYEDTDSGTAYGFTTDEDGNTTAVISVYMDAGTVKDIYGGRSYYGNAKYNSVYIEGDAAAETVYGGRADSGGSAEYNSVEILGNASISGGVYGGYSLTGTSGSNSVKVSGGTLSSGITGGQAGTDSSGTGSSYLNTVSVSGGSVTGAVYGGHAYSGDAYANQVSVSDGSITGGVTGNFSVKGSVNGSYEENDDSVSLTSVSMSGGTVTGNIVGGYSSEGTAELNSVVITGGTVTDGSEDPDEQTEDEGGNIYGAYSHDADVCANSVDISGESTVIDNDVFGNYSDEASAYGVSSAGTAVTSVEVSDGEIGGDVVGGKVNGEDQTAAANSVVISGGEIGGNVYGNWSKKGTATGVYTDDEDSSTEVTAVTISGGTIVGDVYAGNAENGTAEYNALEMTGGTVGTATDGSSDDDITGSVYGGYSSEGSAVHNTVTMSGGTVYGYVAGGYVDVSGDADNNTVAISGNATVESYVYGGKSKQSGNASNNTVTIGTKDYDSTESSSAVTLNGSVYGGSAPGGNVVGNRVEVLSGDVTVDASIYAGYTESGYSQANSILIEDGTVTDTLWGNYSKSSDASGVDGDGNAVTTIEIKGGSVNAVTGGYSKSGTAYANSVVISDGTVSSAVRGNRTDIGTATGAYTGSDGNTSEVTAIEVTGGVLTSSLYGGYANSTGTAKVNTVKVSGGIVNTSYGGYSASGVATENAVKVSGGTVKSARGGGTDSGEVYENTVSITGGTVTNVYGGYSSGEGTVHENTVEISEGVEIAGSVWGGYSASGTVYNSEVTTGGYSVAGDVIGGESGSGEAYLNKVNISDGTEETTIGGAAYGGKSSGSATVSANSVTVTGGSTNTIYGNYSYSGTATSSYTSADTDDDGDETATVTETAVSVSGGTVTTVYGNYSYSGEATGTADTDTPDVSVTDGTVTTVYGGGTDSGTATGNTVSVTGGTVSSVYGAYASGDGEVSKNAVKIAAGTDGTPTVEKGVYGGYDAGSGDAEENSVDIGDGLSLSSDIYGGYVAAGTASGNTITVTGTYDEDEGTFGTTIGSLYGGYSSGSGIVTGNSVIVSGTKVSGSAEGGRSVSGNAESNRVSITNSEVTGAVYGNYAESGSATGSTTTTTDDDSNEITVADTDTDTLSVYISGSSIGGNVEGGHASSDADYNTVKVTSSTLTGNSSIFGGYTTGGNADGNVLTVESTTGITSIEGGATKAAASASSNTVTVSGTTEAVNVYGGYSDLYGTTDDNRVNSYGGSYTYTVGGYTLGGTADGNEVYITGGSYGYVMGAVSWDYRNSSSNTTGAVTNNTVTVSPKDGTGITIGAHVSGGFTAYGYEASGNEVTIESGTTVRAAVSGGILFVGSSVSGNTVTINGGEIHGADVAGFFDQVAVVGGGLGKSNTTEASVTDNHAVINGGTIEGDVYGGYSVDGTADAPATENTVLITDGEITGSIYGGRSEYGDATENTVTITGGTVKSDTASIADVSISQGLIVEFERTNKTLTGDVYGGASDHSGDASSNNVYLGTDVNGKEYDGTVSIAGSVYGGHAVVTNNNSGVSDAISNSVVSVGAEIGGSVYGGYVYSYQEGQSEAETGDADENTVTLTDTAVTGAVYGGYTYSGSASTTSSGDSDSKTAVTGSADENTVTISGGSATSVYGGYTEAQTTTENSSDSTSGTADSNDVTVTGAEISGSVYGGYSTAEVFNDDATASSDGASSNEVYVSGSSSVGASVYGGYSTGAADGNVVTIGTAADETTEGDTTEEDTSASSTKRRASSASLPSDDSEDEVASVSEDEDDDDTEIAGSVYGGQGESASGNTVIVYSGTVGENVYGNYATTGTATSVADDGAVTAVIISGGTVENNVYGNYSESGEAVGTGDTDTPDVSMTGGTVENTVYGGQGTSATGNVVSISGTAEVGLDVVGGRATASEGSASGNIVQISNNAVIGTNSIAYTGNNDTSEDAEGEVIAGYAPSGSATDNSVNMTGGSVYGNVTGAYGSTTVTDNTVAISGGSVTGYAYGGYGASNSEATVSVNCVKLSGDATVGYVYGGYSESSSATVTDNHVTMSGSATVADAVIGGFNYSSTEAVEVTENTVEITEGATVSGYVYGGHSFGSVSENKVIIDGDGKTANASSIIGGCSFGSDATANTVTVSNALIQLQSDDGTTYSGKAVIYGGYGTTASGNTVTVTSSSTVDGTIYGNYATTGTATGSITETTTDDGNEETSTTYTTSVTITDSTVSGSVYGGYSYSGDATYNAVSLKSSSIGGDVYGGYSYSSSGSTVYNSVSIYGDVSVTGTIYGGRVSSDYTGNSLWVASTGNSALTIANFATITFDVDGLENDDVMLTLSDTNTLDLTGLGEGAISVANDDASSLATDPGETLYLIVTSNGISVSADSLSEVSGGSATYTLDEDYDTEEGTSYIEGGASLTGSYDRALMVVSTETEDGTLSVTSEAEADDEGNLSGTALVLRTSETVDVERVDFNLAETTQSENSLEWGTTLITLDSDVKYAFDTAVNEDGDTVGATIEDIEALTVTGISGTLIADEETSKLLDGSDAAVSGLDEVDLDGLNNVDENGDAQGIKITYSPSESDEITVTGTVIVKTADADSDGASHSLVLSSSSIDSITFGKVYYSSETAPVQLDSGNTYDMSKTDIDVRGLTLVDTGDLTFTDGSDDPGMVIMTLIEANGAVTNLDKNEIAENSAEDGTVGGLEIGYTLEGADEDGSTGAELSGTMYGYVNVEEDDTEGAAEGAYDLVIKADTTVNVSSVDFGLTATESEDGEAETVEIAWGDDALLTLNRDLSYDFAGSTGEDGEAAAATVSGLDGEITITGDATESALLAIDAATTLLDGSSSTVTSLDEVDLESLKAEYSYAPADGVTVTGEVSVQTDTLGETEDENSEADSLVLVIDSITAMDFDVTGQTAGSTMLELTESSSTDLDNAVVTITDGLGTLSLRPGETLTLVSATSGSVLDVTGTTLTEIDEGYATLEYSLPDENVTGEATLDGTYGQSLQYVDKTTEGETTTASSIVLAADSTVDVTAVDFGLEADEDTGTATITWSSSPLITLEDEDTGIEYAFSDTTEITGIADTLEVTGDAVSGTLIADGDTTTLLDGSSASVSGLDEVDLDELNNVDETGDVQGIKITYSPSESDEITVTGTVIVETSDEDSDGTSHSLVLSSTSIDSITFGEVVYSDTAPIKLVSGSTYDMSKTTIDVSDLTLVDSEGSSVTLTLTDDDVEEVVMTLIESNGSVTNLGSNETLPASAESQSFNYLLEGTDSAKLNGTMTGSVSAEATDDDTEGTYADLVLKAGTNVSVTSVDLGDLETDEDGSTVIEWDSGARLTLNSALTYDFGSAELSEDSTAALSSSIVITGVENDLLASGESLTFIDGSSSTVISIDELGSSETDYTYTPADGVTVEGTAASGALGGNDDETPDSYGLTITDIETIDFDVEDREDGSVMLSLTDEVTDLSGVEITLTNDETITDTGYTLTLIGTSGSLTTTDIVLPELEDGSYSLEDGTSGATLDGSFERTVSEVSDDAGTVTAIVLTTGTEISVTDVDLSIDGTLTWDTEGDALITLESGLSYDFSSSQMDELSELVLEGIEGTLAANGESVVLIDGTASDGVTGLDTLTDEVTTGYTYAPAGGFTVSGTTEGGTSDDGSSLTMSISTISSIEIGEIEYSEDAPIILEEGKTYDLSETEIDVSSLTLVDSEGSPVIPDADGGKIVMTLIDADGAVTNLGSNDIAEDAAETPQTFGYKLEGDGEAVIDGTLNGVVTASAEDGDSDGTYADLVLKADTAVAVTEVTLDLQELTLDDPQLVLTSGLSYDFSNVTDDDITVVSNDGTTEITGADTLLSGSILIIDGSNAEDVSGIDALAGLSTVYEYSIDTGTAEIDVTGDGTTVVTGSTSLSYSLLNVLTLDFWIDEDTPTDEPVLTVESSVDLSSTDVTLHAEGGDYLAPGYTITLLDAGELVTTDETTYATVIEGVSVEYDLTLAREDNALVASIPEDAERELRDETSSLAVTRLAQTAMIDQGADMLALAFDEAFMTTREKTKWTPYVAMSAGDFEYGISGGSLDIESFNATVGLLRNHFRDDGVISWGPVFQYGKGEYDSCTHGVSAEGDAEYVGGGLFARRRWNSGLYVEGAVTGGYSQADYGSDTLLDGEIATFDVGSAYWAAYAAIAKDYALSHGRTFKPYVKYNYSHLNDADARLSSGETYRFGDVDSSRLRAGFRFIWNMNGYDAKLADRYYTYLGAAYQYQFDGSAVGVYDGMSTHTSSLKGGSGVFEGGLYFRPKESNMTLNLGVTGWCGEQQGFEGLLKFKWDL